ncbi:MAG: guaD [Verrucomicrobiaceae bacterium]|nr:guaD [Verrucomicrobiaceae bacterium]
MTSSQTLLRGSTISFRKDPFLYPAAECFDYHSDGGILIQAGKIIVAGAFAQVQQSAHADAQIIHYPNSIISAGFIDTHVHYPQTQMVAAFGEQLLQWLEKYTFITEQQFADKAHADRIADFFLHELLRNGVTTAAVYCTVHPQSVDAFFEASQRLNTLMIAGKVLMDRNAPAALLDTAQRGYDESKTLIERWHGNGRQHYCITPRFAGTSTEAQLDVAGNLWREFPSTFMQTHLSENKDEVNWMRELYPHRDSYLDIYAHANLLGSRSLYAHCIHIDENDLSQLHHTGSAIAHCPTSNLFLGSGLFKLFDAKRIERPVRVGIGSDIGAGTSFSPLQSLNEAYKIARLHGDKLDALRAFYLATRGGAHALYLDDRIGSIEAGMDADLVVLDLHATPLLKMRTDYARDINELLFILIMLGDDRCTRATYVAGECVFPAQQDAKDK